MATIRPYDVKDRDRVQAICLANAGCAEAEEDMQKYILNMYCNYYIDCEPENCFVAVDDYDKAIGYIICTQNCDYYEQRFKEDYIPVMLDLGFKYYIDAKLDIISHTMFRNSYSPHLHIDILDGYQGQGIGTELINTLKAHLRAKGLRNVMLVVGEDNEGAIRFYERNGFEKLITTHLGVAMGIGF